jgi:predicted CopG family antitoxin
MSLADEQIRVSSAVKRELGRRRREGDSFNDVLERLLFEERDLFAGFGAFAGTDRGESTRRVHETGARQSSERIERIAASRERGEE